METKIQLDQNIELRATAPDWAAEKYTAALASRDHLLPWLTWVHFYEDCETAEAGIEKMREFQVRKAEEFSKDAGYTYDIFYDGVFAGSIELMNVDRFNQTCEIGYWLAKDFTGRGIITKAVNLLTDLAFEKLEMHCVVIRAADKNMTSRAVAERCGFEFDATLRERLFLEGERYGMCIFSKIKP